MSKLQSLLLTINFDSSLPLPWSVENNRHALKNENRAKTCMGLLSEVAKCLNEFAHEQDQCEKHIISITVEGGCVQFIGNIPSNVQVIVRDYDVEGIDEETIPKDQDGHPFLESLWEDN